MSIFMFLTVYPSTLIIVNLIRMFKFLMKMPEVSDLLLVALSFSVNYQHEISLMPNTSKLYPPKK